MSVKLERLTIPVGISVDDMIDGQIAEIMYHHDNNAIGLIIQRYKSVLIVLSKDSKKSYKNSIGHNSTMRVRLLENGEAFTVVENEG